MGQMAATTIAACIIAATRTREVSQIDIQAMIEKHAYEAAGNIKGKMIDLIERA
jgi:hypothetical protein